MEIGGWRECLEALQFLLFYPTNASILPPTPNPVRSRAELESDQADPSGTVYRPIPALDTAYLADANMFSFCLSSNLASQSKILEP